MAPVGRRNPVPYQLLDVDRLGATFVHLGLGLDHVIHGLLPVELSLFDLGLTGVAGDRVDARLQGVLGGAGGRIGGQRKAAGCVRAFIVANGAFRIGPGAVGVLIAVVQIGLGILEVAANRAGFGVQSVDFVQSVHPGAGAHVRHRHGAVDREAR